MWVKLRTRKRFEVGGVMTVYERGDWVDVGKQTALLWVANNEAEIPAFKASAVMPKNSSDFGILITGNCEVGKALLVDMSADFDVRCGDPAMHWEFNCLWNPKVPQILLKRFLAVGFMLLESWEIAIPLFPYTQLANTVGGQAEQQRTKAIIRDLRVPMYNPDLIFVRQTEATDYFFECWQQEKEDSEFMQLSLLRAMYRAKPFILALPPTWTDPHGVPENE